MPELSPFLRDGAGLGADDSRRVLRIIALVQNPESRYVTALTLPKHATNNPIPT